MGGLLSRGLLGGPLAEWLMRRHDIRGTGESKAGAGEAADADTASRPARLTAGGNDAYDHGRMKKDDGSNPGTGRDDGQIRGRTRRSKVVVFDGDPGRIGAYTYTRLDRTTGATFAGTEVEAGVAEPVPV